MSCWVKELAKLLAGCVLDIRCPRSQHRWANCSYKPRTGPRIVSYPNYTGRLDTVSRWYRPVHAKDLGVFRCSENLWWATRTLQNTPILVSSSWIVKAIPKLMAFGTILDWGLINTQQRQPGNRVRSMFGQDQVGAGDAHRSRQRLVRPGRDYYGCQPKFRPSEP